MARITGALQAQHYGPIDGPGTAALAGLPREDYPLLDGLASSMPPGPG